MSWDAWLEDDRGHWEGDWNFTHNCNGMANTVLDAEYEQRSVAEEVFCVTDKEHVSWWKQLDGLSGPAGAALLGRIIKGLRDDPAKFAAMNPPNGWGSYDTFLEVLEEMHQAVPEWPTTWHVSG